jgi:Arc/MetJ family transcription regulator
MRVTVDIDDELFIKAANLAGPLGPSAIVNEGLRALVQRESARRLARLGGTQAALETGPRRRARTRP